MGNKYLKIKKHETLDYYYAERLGVDSIAFVLYDKDRGFGLIREFKPPINDFLITAFGGSIDKNKSLVDIVIEEVKEEAGYTVTPREVKYRGKKFVSTQMNQWCHLFLVDVTGLSVGEREPQNHLESIAEVVWLPKDKILRKEFHDWKAQVIVTTVFNGYFSHLFERYKCKAISSR